MWLWKLHKRQEFNLSLFKCLSIVIFLMHDNLSWYKFILIIKTLLTQRTFSFQDVKKVLDCTFYISLLDLKHFRNSFHEKLQNYEFTFKIAKKCKFFQKTREYRSLISAALSLAEFVPNFSAKSILAKNTIPIDHSLFRRYQHNCRVTRKRDKRINIFSSWLRLVYCILDCNHLYVFNMA